MPKLNVPDSAAKKVQETIYLPGDLYIRYILENVNSFCLRILAYYIASYGETVSEQSIATHT